MQKTACFKQTVFYLLLKYARATGKWKRARCFIKNISKNFQKTSEFLLKKRKAKICKRFSANLRLFMYSDNCFVKSFPPFREWRWQDRKRRSSKRTFSLHFFCSPRASSCNNFWSFYTDCFRCWSPSFWQFR